ncbi:hypothetical protein [Mesorhizobium sp. LNJC391B00]|uniref:hypothetical protein n=1 Tax=Mesorhizobium sp. LNJC391B00 TaxID=1287273 RepID=UPI0003CF62F9|nr:hypothetical protein [Mesorhizobium sp. LNJC391B00]ESY31604.1 hypothetical protein X749_07800 [Mesorhizobium sp. LNJC391B00]
MFLTLATRFIGAFFFGRLADKIWPQAHSDAQHRQLFGGRRAGCLLAQSRGYALALFAGVVAVCIIVVIRFSPERRGQVMTVLG